MKEKDQFHEWYSRRFSQIAEEPPKEVWDNISNELDVNAVWNKIDSRLTDIDRRKVFVRRASYSVLALLLLLISGSLFFKTDTNSKNKIILSNKETNHSSKDVASSNYVKTNHAEKEFTKSSSVPQNFNVSIPSSESSFVNSSPEQNQHQIARQKQITIVRKYSNVNEHDNASVSAVNVIQGNADTSGLVAGANELFIVPMPTSLIAVNVVDSFMPRFTLYYITADSNKYAQRSTKNQFHGFYLGGVFSSHNTWLLNQLTFDGLKANSLNETKISFGYSFGISTGYNFSDQWGGELNWYVNSQQGQTYNMYNEGQYVARKIKMDFSILNPMLKYRNQGYSNLMKTADSKNILMGINMGMLKSGEDNSNFQSEDITTRYHKINYSLQIGYEYELISFHKLLLSSAIIANLGVKNMYKGDSYIPASFNRTHIASMGFNIGMKYLLR